MKQCRSDLPSVMTTAAALFVVTVGLESTGKRKTRYLLIAGLHNLQKSFLKNTSELRPFSEIFVPVIPERFHSPEYSLHA